MPSSSSPLSSYRENNSRIADLRQPASQSLSLILSEGCWSINIRHYPGCERTPKCELSRPTIYFRPTRERYEWGGNVRPLARKRCPGTLFFFVLINYPLKRLGTRYQKSSSSQTKIRRSTNPSVLTRKSLNSVSLFSYLTGSSLD